MFDEQNRVIELECDKVTKSSDGNKVRFYLQDVLNVLPDDFYFESSQKEIQAILDCIHDGIYITDGTGKTLMLNKAEKEYEKSYHDIKVPEDLLGINVQEFVDKGYWDQSVCMEVIRSGKEKSHLQEVNGIEILTTGIPFYENGKITRVVATDRDVSKLYELQRKITVTEKKIKKTRARIEYEAKIRKNDLEKLIYQSEKMNKIVNMISKISHQDVTVLICGESGCGKEMIADMIVQNSNRKNEPFVKINCGAIPDSLIESELFGYEKGAFTGADSNGKIGIFEAADGGTVLLDEIGELPMNMQVKLLRVLQEKEIIRIGGSGRSIPVDVRIIAATNVDLKKKIDDGEFREDLYYRLNIVPIDVPPLRERSEDIDALVEYFVSMFNEKYGANILLENSAINIFKSYAWPGNVRELKNLIERMIVTLESGKIDVYEARSYIYHDGNFDRAVADGRSLKDAVDSFEKALLEDALKKAKNGIGVSELLKISPSAVSKKFKKYGIVAKT